MGAFVSFQTGTITIANGSATGSTTLGTTVNRANCYLTHHGLGIDSTMTNSSYRIIISSDGTTVTATRAGTSGNVVIDFEVYEDTGLTTQWVSLTQSTSPVDTTITAVDLARTIVVALGVTRSSTSRGWDDYVTPTLTSTTNLRTTMSQTAQITTVFMIVQFDSDLITSCNYYAKGVTATTDSQTITSVTTSKSLVIPSGVLLPTSIVHSTEFHSFGLDSSTSVGFESYATPGGTMNYGFWVVEFANLTVTHGSQTSASATPTISLGASPTRGALIMGAAFGITATDNADDGFDRDSFRASVSSSTWTLTRTTADDSKLRYCTFDWATLRSAGSTSISVLLNQLRTQGIA